MKFQSIKVLFWQDRRAQCVVLFFLMLGIFNFHFESLGSGDTVPAELLPVSIIYDHNFQFNRFIRDDFQLPFFTNSTQKPLPYYFRNVHGKIISIYSIIPGILNLPVYLIAHIFGVDLVNNRLLLSQISATIIAAFSVVFMFLTLLAICQQWSTAVFFTFVYAFGTGVWSTASHAMWQHGPSLLFINIVLFLLFKKDPRSIAYAGFFGAMAIFNRPTTMAFIVPLTLYVFNAHRDKFKNYLLMAAIPLSFLFLYSYAYWGTVLSFGEKDSSGMFHGNFLPGLAGILISPNRGLFFFSPIFIFSFFYLIEVLFTRYVATIYKYLSWGAVFLLLGVADFDMWWGGACFGYRLLIEIVPVFIILGAIYWERLIRRNILLKSLFFIFLSISIYTHFLGTFFYPSEYNQSLQPRAHAQEMLWNIKEGELMMDSIKFKTFIRGKFYACESPG